MSLSALNFVDYIVLAVLVGSGILATLRGLTREILGLAGWGVAVILARLLQPLMFNFLEDYIKEETVVEILAWSVPFVAVVLAWFVFANITAPGLKKVAFGNLDRPLGFLFGVLRGLVIVALIYVGVLLLTKSEESFPETVLTSASIAPVRIVASIMTGYAPQNIREDMQDAIPDQDIDDIKEGFSEEVGEQLENIQENAEEKVEDIIEDAEGGDLLPDEEIIPLPKSN